MPIDIEKAIGAALPGSTYSWEEDDVILYHLGIGAGDPPTDPRELRYAYEANLVVLPTFGTIPPFGVMMSMGMVEGFEVDLSRILHGEQEIVVHRPIPTSATVVQEGRITHVYDKGKGALAIIEIDSKLESGESLFTNRSSIYVRGEGGFGGDPGPSASTDVPDRDPDRVVESRTLPQQALLYRMSSGDKNPLHADPAFAAFAGFERPILHGLCTYGIVAKAVVDHGLEGRAEAVASYRARFSGVVFPGETIVTNMWREGEGFVVSAHTAERGESVLSNGFVGVRS